MNQHLKDSNTTYTEHARWAFIASGQLLWASIASFFHAIYPSLFPGTSAKIIIDLYYKRLVTHPNPYYREYINQQKAKYQPEEETK
jgi:hypothetical protein